MDYTSIAILIERLIDAVRPSEISLGRINGIQNSLNDLKRRAPGISNVVSKLDKFEQELDKWADIRIAHAGGHVIGQEPLPLPH